MNVLPLHTWYYGIHTVMRFPLEKSCTSFCCVKSAFLKKIRLYNIIFHKCVTVYHHSTGGYFCFFFAIANNGMMVIPFHNKCVVCHFVSFGSSPRSGNAGLKDMMSGVKFPCNSGI